MKPYSVDLRTRVVDAVEDGMPREQAVLTFRVSLASLKRWLAARRSSGSLAPLAASGGPQPKIAPEQEHLLRLQVAAFPDATLPEHTERWNQTHGTTISEWTIGRAIRRLGITRKKKA